MIKKGVPQKDPEMEKNGKLEDLKGEEKIGMATPKVVDKGHGKETEDGLDMVKQ